MDEKMAFGMELKRLRQLAGMSTREVSKSAGKSPAYVSQVERGLIKTPDYGTCLQLLTALDIDDETAKALLDGWGIASPEQFQAEIEREILAFEQSQENQVELLKMGWYETSAKELRKQNDRMHLLFDKFIDRDLSRAESVIRNLLALTKTKEDFDFFCSIFELDLSHIDTDSREAFIRMVQDFYHNDVEAQFGTSKYPKMEDDNG